MIADGVLENPKPDVALGLHVGTICLGPGDAGNGGVMAAADSLPSKCRRGGMARSRSCASMRY